MISIIIPVFNAEKFIGKCLFSVINQTYTTWECLLVDDGSTDGSGHICDEWQMRDTRFRVFHQQNKGVSVARNRGMTEIKGDYLCFVDADDWIEPNFLETLVNHSYDADWVLSGQIREWSVRKKTVYKPECTESFLLNEEHADTFVNLCRNFLLYAPHEKLYRTDIIRQNKLTFREGCQYGEDLIFNFQYLELVNRIATIDIALYHYRMGTKTLSTMVRPNQFDEDYMQWHIIEDFYKRQGLWNNNAKDYLYHRLWGIVYDGIFLFPCLRKPCKDYLNRILSIPEITALKDYQSLYPCTWWIKKAVLYKIPFVFKVYFFIKYKG